jgi:hypothetical protein
MFSNSTFLWALVPAHGQRTILIPRLTQAKRKEVHGIAAGSVRWNAVAGLVPGTEFCPLLGSCVSPLPPIAINIFMSHNIRGIDFDKYSPLIAELHLKCFITLRVTISKSSALPVDSQIPPTPRHWRTHVPPLHHHITNVWN